MSKPDQLASSAAFRSLAANTFASLGKSSLPRKNSRVFLTMSVWLSRCPLLVECQGSVSRGDSTDKGQRGAALYRWNVALNRWTECHAVLLTPLWPTKSHLYAALPAQVAILEHKRRQIRCPKAIARGQVQILTAPNSTNRGQQKCWIPTIISNFQGRECKFH
jgi:hypothetical protein